MTGELMGLATFIMQCLILPPLGYLLLANVRIEKRLAAFERDLKWLTGVQAERGKGNE